MKPERLLRRERETWLENDTLSGMWLCLMNEAPDGTRPSTRKERLFAAACCRRAWAALTDERLRRAVDTVERYCGGVAGEGERAKAQEDAVAAYVAADDRGDAVARLAALAVQDAADLAEGHHIAEEVASNTARAVGHSADDEAEEAEEAEERAQRAVLRDIFFSPFRPAPDVSARMTPVAVSLARAAYESRALPSGELDNSRLAVLSDALEEAGAADAELLGHLRSPGPHVRGCWALDLILGKE